MQTVNGVRRREIEGGSLSAGVISVSACRSERMTDTAPGGVCVIEWGAKAREAWEIQAGMKRKGCRLGCTPVPPAAKRAVAP